MNNGYGIVYQSVMRNSKLSPEAKCIYAYLSTFADKDGLCYPSIKTLTFELGIGYKRLSAHMKQLQQQGIIEKVQLRDKGSFGLNVYRVTHGKTSPLGRFALTPDALPENALTPDAITPKAITEKAITPNAPTNNTNTKHYQEINNTINQMNNTTAEHYQSDNSTIDDEHYHKLKDTCVKDAYFTENYNIKAENAKRGRRFNHNLILDMYNKICTSSPRVNKMSDGRRRELDKRKNEGYTMDDFELLFRLAQEGKHLTLLHYPLSGSTKIMKIPTMDWLIQKTVMDNILTNARQASQNAPQSTETQFSYNVP